MDTPTDSSSERDNPITTSNSKGVVDKGKSQDVSDIVSGMATVSLEDVQAIEAVSSSSSTMADRMAAEALISLRNGNGSMDSEVGVKIPVEAGKMVQNARIPVVNVCWADEVELEQAEIFKQANGAGGNHCEILNPVPVAGLDFDNTVIDNDGQNNVLGISSGGRDGSFDRLVSDAVESSVVSMAVEGSAVIEEGGGKNNTARISTTNEIDVGNSEVGASEAAQSVSDGSAVDKTASQAEPDSSSDSDNTRVVIHAFQQQTEDIRSCKKDEERKDVSDCKNGARDENSSVGMLESGAGDGAGPGDDDGSSGSDINVNCRVYDAGSKNSGVGMLESGAGGKAGPGNDDGSSGSDIDVNCRVYDAGCKNSGVGMLESGAGGEAGPGDDGGSSGSDIDVNCRVYDAGCKNSGVGMLESGAGGEAGPFYDDGSSGSDIDVNCRVYDAGHKNNGVGMLESGVGGEAGPGDDDGSSGSDIDVNCRIVETGARSRAFPPVIPCKVPIQCRLGVVDPPIVSEFSNSYSSRDSSPVGADGRIENSDEELERARGNPSGREETNAEPGELGGSAETENATKDEKKVEIPTDRDRRNPQYIPREGYYYYHDDRFNDESDTKKKEEKVPERKSRLPEGKWSHDKYVEREQTSKSRKDIMNEYGYDIRNEEGPPRTRRHRKYTRGMASYDRDWKDEGAYSSSGKHGKSEMKDQGKDVKVKGMEQDTKRCESTPRYWTHRPSTSRQRQEREPKVATAKSTGFWHRHQPSRSVGFQTRQNNSLQNRSFPAYTTDSRMENTRSATRSGAGTSGIMNQRRGFNNERNKSRDYQPRTREFRSSRPLESFSGQTAVKTTPIDQNEPDEKTEKKETKNSTPEVTVSSAGENSVSVTPVTPVVSRISSRDPVNRAANRVIASVEEDATRNTARMKANITAASEVKPWGKYLQDTKRGDTKYVTQSMPQSSRRYSYQRLQTTHMGLGQQHPPQFYQTPPPLGVSVTATGHGGMSIPVPPSLHHGPCMHSIIQQQQQQQQRQQQQQQPSGANQNMGPILPIPPQHMAHMPPQQMQQPIMQPQPFMAQQQQQQLQQQMQQQQHQQQVHQQQMHQPVVTIPQGTIIPPSVSIAHLSTPPSLVPYYQSPTTSYQGNEAAIQIVGMYSVPPGGQPIQNTSLGYIPPVVTAAQLSVMPPGAPYNIPPPSVQEAQPPPQQEFSGPPFIPTAPVNPQGIPSMYGATYYNVQAQMQSHPPPRRVNAAIPIVPPPEDDPAAIHGTGANSASE